MYINENISEFVLGSPAKIRILTTLLKWREGELTERQLAGLCELSTFGTRHALADLERSLIVTKKVIGKANIWRLNRESYAFQTLKPILDQLVLLKKPMASVKEILISQFKKEGVKKIIIFGSVLDEQEEAGDIDICILLNETTPASPFSLRYHSSSQELQGLVDQAAEKIFSTVGKRIEVHFFTPKEWERTQTTPLGQSILKGKEIYPREEI